MVSRILKKAPHESGLFSHYAVGGVDSGTWMLFGMMSPTLFAGMMNLL